MNLEDWLTQPDGLATRLRTLRAQAGLTGHQLADQLGWVPSKVSKIENGRQAPSAADVDTWARACGADSDTAHELLDLVSQARVVHQDWRRRLRRGQVQTQNHYAALLSESTSIRQFHTVYIPGMLQTPGYARHPITEGVRLHRADPGDVDEAVTVRMRRQQILYDTSKRFEFVLWEPALGSLVAGCPPDVMIGQLDRLLVAMGLPNVRIGIVPLFVPCPTTPQNSFQIYQAGDEPPTVLVESFVGEQTLTGDDADAYVRVMSLLWDQAVEGAEARVLMLAAADRLRQPNQSHPAP